MLSTPVLSDEQIDTFKNDGYLVLRQAFDAEEMTRIETWARELVALPEETGKHWVYHEKSLKGDGADLISRIENIAPFHDGFAELSAVLKAPVAQLLGEKAALFKEKVNFKMPGGDGFKPHQDSQAGWDDYADFFISALVSIDEANVENGCLQMCGGHHQKGLFKSWEPLSESPMREVLCRAPQAPGRAPTPLSDSLRRVKVRCQPAEGCRSIRSFSQGPAHRRLVESGPWLTDGRAPNPQCCPALSDRGSCDRRVGRVPSFWR